MNHLPANDSYAIFSLIVLENVEFDARLVLIESHAMLSSQFRHRADRKSPAQLEN